MKANGRKPKSCLGRVFNYKLGCFDNVHVFIYVDARPHLYLKTQSTFRPVILKFIHDHIYEYAAENNYRNILEH